MICHGVVIRLGGGREVAGIMLEWWEKGDGRMGLPRSLICEAITLLVQRTD
jgi:hypothetical protein